MVCKGTLIENADKASYTPSTDKTGVYNYYVVITNTNTSVNGETDKTIQSETVKVVVNNAQVIDPVIDENAPNVTVGTDSQHILDSALTEEDHEKLDNGYDISLLVQVNEISEVNKDDESVIGSALGDNELGLYVDLSIIKNMIDTQGNQTQEKVTSLSDKIRITIDIPENLRKTDRTYSVIRVHNGVTEVLLDLDSDPNTITIETDRFSTYAIVYADSSSDENSNNVITGDSSSIISYALLAFGSLVLALFILKKKKYSEAKN